MTISEANPKSRAPFPFVGPCIVGFILPPFQTTEKPMMIRMMICQWPCFLVKSN